MRKHDIAIHPSKVRTGAFYIYINNKQIHFSKDEFDRDLFLAALEMLRDKIENISLNRVVEQELYLVHDPQEDDIVIFSSLPGSFKNLSLGKEYRIEKSRPFWDKYTHYKITIIDDAEKLKTSEFRRCIFKVFRAGKW